MMKKVWYTFMIMKQIEFLGASGDEVTGSCYVITADDGGQVMVDFGMFQGKKEIVAKNYDLLAFHPPNIQAVFLTHGHLDHCGRLPLLVFGGFTGKIYMTAPTRAFVELILLDSARIAENDVTKQPLYTTEEVYKILKMIEIVDYEKEVVVGNFRAKFIDAGHILGSSSIELTDTSGDTPKSIVFSGDLGNTPQDIVRPTQYIDEAHIVVMESTYGDSAHPEEDAKKIVQEEINAVEANNGVLLIPAFALERTQELLHIIHHLKKDGKVKAETPVFLDSPMGIEATAVYMDFKEYYNEEIKAHTDIPFNFGNLMITDMARESRRIIEEPAPKIIIAGSGMMSGGRIMHHAANYLDKPTTRILFVGYQAEETMGREILEGAKHVVIDKRQIQVKANIREIKILSSHADQPRLLTWLGHIKGVETVFLTHGEKEQRIALAAKIKDTLKIQHIELPAYQSTYNITD
jgi:metallo-beta-lactamase family protein